MNRIAAVVAGLLLAFVGTSATYAATHTVCPSGCDYTTIQAAIDMSHNGDVINIHAGTYHEHNLNTHGGAITIQGALNSDGTHATTIDAQSKGGVFRLLNREGPGTVIKNLVIKGGHTSFGGGIFCDGTSPTITRCTISHNIAHAGGGISCDSGHPTITDCLIQENTAINFGGGIFLNNSNPTIDDCFIWNNHADSSPAGGGVYAHSSNPTIHGGSFSRNTPPAIVGVIPSLLGDGTEIGYITLQDCVICDNGDETTQVQLLGAFIHAGENHIHANCNLNSDPGDLDGDGDVDTDDLSLMHVATEICHHDVSHDGITGIDDFLDVIKGWGQSCAP